MKVTKIRINGKKPSEIKLQSIANELNTRFAKAGFITECGPITSTSLKIGLHMKTFILDISKHDRNLQCNPHLNPKLTKLPTWAQRVEFNNIVNAVLDKHNVSANVRSGPFTIRIDTHSYSEYDWHCQKPDWIRHNESSGYFIEAVNEKQFLEERRIRKNREAAHKRNMAKQYSNITQDSIPKLRLVK